MLGIPELEGAEWEMVLREEIEKARRALTAPAAGDGVEGMGVDAAAAEKAFEEGKKRLEGFVRPRSASQVERVVG